MSICRFDLSPERVSRQHCAKQIKLLHCAYMSRPRDDMHDGYGVLAIMKHEVSIRISDSVNGCNRVCMQSSSSFPSLHTSTSMHVVSKHYIIAERTTCICTWTLTAD
jgi:hypothetical protein